MAASTARGKWEANLINIRALKKQLAELKRRVKVLEAKFNT